MTFGSMAGRWGVAALLLALTSLSTAPVQAQESAQQRDLNTIELPRADSTPELPAAKDAELTQPRTPEGEQPRIQSPRSDDLRTSQEAAGQSQQRKATSLPQDLSAWGMFRTADIVVKAVMVGLAVASFVTWTVWFAKVVELWGAKRRLKRAISQIRAAPTLSAAVETFSGVRGMGTALVREAAEEMVRSAPALNHRDGHQAIAGVKERITSRLSRVEANAGRRMTLGTGLLATIGATAPFVGLFGTVWGIMNSFVGISQSQTTNLAVVAPGIAEALLATALGLVAAIPAVIIYNVFARSIAGYRLLLADTSAGVERLVSWELDARHISRDGALPMLARAAE